MSSDTCPKCGHRPGSHQHKCTVANCGCDRTHDDFPPYNLPFPTDRLFSLPTDAYKVTSDDCYTPRWVFDAMGLTFDLDVAAPPGGPWHVPATAHYTAEDDGLAQQWKGLVWCNPPYSKFRPWVDRWAEHPTGVLMGTYAPELYATPVLLGAADAVAFVSVKFTLPDGAQIKPRHGVVVAFRGVGTEPAERLAAADKYGAVLYGRAA